MSDIDRQTILALPSAQQEPHYCRECKFSRCHVNVDKHGKSETYWRCVNWDGETDEEGYCHEWKKKEQMDDLIYRQAAIEAEDYEHENRK